MESITNIELPSPPHAALELIRLCGDADADISDIIKVIQVDGALTVKLMKAANSAYYCQQYEVTTLRRAAVVIGINQVKALGLSFHLADQASRWTDVPFDLKSLWQGNVLRACLARQAAINAHVMPVKCPDEAFLVGLLQDFAVPIMGKSIGEDYREMVGGAGLYTSFETVQREHALTETNHAHLAGRIFDMWKFPPLLTFAVTNHHVLPEPERPKDKAMALWQLAHWVASIHFDDNRQTAPVGESLRQIANASFGLSEEALAVAFYRAVEDYEMMREFFVDLLPDRTADRETLQRAQKIILDRDDELEGAT